MQQVFNDVALPLINKLRHCPTCARVITQSQVIEPAAELLAPFSWFLTRRQHGEVELLRALVPARGPASVHQVETLIRKWPFLQRHGSNVSHPQQVQPKVFPSPRSPSTSQTAGHLWSWRMEKRRRHNICGCGGRCRTSGPENRDSVNT